MNSTSGLIAASTLVIVIVGWFVFTAVFLLRKKPQKTEEQKRDKVSIVGIVLQMIGYALVWSVRRPIFTAVVGNSTTLNALFLGITTVLVVSSVWLVTKAVQTLGKQWSFAARLVKGHQLIIEGPYRIVRHPIYTGMMGMMVASGLAISRWWAILAALAMFVTGTMVRVRIEERLLREEFGQRYDEYAAQVPALLPLKSVSYSTTTSPR